MKFNSANFPSVIVLLGVFLLAALFLGSGNVMPYSSVSNYSAFEGLEDMATTNTDANSGGIMENAANTITDTAVNVGKAVSSVFGGGSDTTTAVTSPPATGGNLESFTSSIMPNVEAFSGSSYASYN